MIVFIREPFLEEMIFPRPVRCRRTSSQARAHVALRIHVDEEHLLVVNKASPAHRLTGSSSFPPAFWLETAITLAVCPGGRCSSEDRSF